MEGTRHVLKRVDSESFGPYANGVSERKKSRLRRWLIWTPVVLAVVGFGAMLITEYRIGREIDQEVARLFRMGVDVRKISASQNLYPDYDALSKVLERE